MENNKEVATIVADIHQVSPRYVRMVREGECNNPDILETYIDYVQMKNDFIEAKKSFHQQVNELVPFN